MVSALLSGGKGSKFESWVQLTSRSEYHMVFSLFFSLIALRSRLYFCLLQDVETIS